MSLLIDSASARIVLAKSWDLAGFDADAAAYIQRVEWADTTPLESATRTAINNFVIDCKADGIWTAIKASCILAGARTLAGALMPLVGAAPTNFNFMSGDYNRKTGLVGDGSTKYLNSNRNNNADPQNNVHQAAWISTLPAILSAKIFIGAGVVDSGTTHLVSGTGGGLFSRNRNGAPSSSFTLATGFAGQSRAASASYITRTNSASNTTTMTSQTTFSGNVCVFASQVPSLYSDARLAFYSIGESLNLAFLDTRVTALINAINVAF